MIVRAVAGRAASLGIVAFAEGVEAAAQLHRAHAAGCAEARGYFISQPRPASEIAGMLARRAAVAGPAADRRWIPCRPAIAGDQADDDDPSTGAEKAA